MVIMLDHQQMQDINGELNSKDTMVIVLLKHRKKQQQFMQYLKTMEQDIIDKLDWQFIHLHMIQLIVR